VNVRTHRNDKKSTLQLGLSRTKMRFVLANASTKALSKLPAAYLVERNRNDGTHISRFRRKDKEKGLSYGSAAVMVERARVMCAQRVPIRLRYCYAIPSLHYYFISSRNWLRKPLRFTSLHFKR